jgi:hypothetical protein
MPPSNSLLYNSSYFSCAPSLEAYQQEIEDMTIIDPNAGLYDYYLSVVCDLNSVLSDYTYTRNITTLEHSATGEAAAWANLHALLSTGTSNDGVAAQSFLTTLNDGDTTTRTSWDTFWSALLSECIDKEDKDGLSVKMDALKSRIDHPTNTGPYADAAAANAANYFNDVTSSINDSFGATLTAGVPGGMSVANNSFGPTNNFPSASLHFLSAAAVLFYQIHGATTGGEGTLTGDPSDGPVRFALSDGRGFGIRIQCSIVNSRTGIITIIQGGGGSGSDTASESGESGSGTSQEGKS